MTPNPAVESLSEPAKQAVSTAGMTTKVVKGSVWTLGGSLLPLAVSFVTTPFIIRFLGAEGYGVLLLVGLIPTYFSFADFGMGVASTKFASEAYGEGDKKKEAEYVWTATAVAAVSALIVAVPIFVFSYVIVRALNVPDHLLDQASTALKIASASFFAGILASVFNSPMLARLRMDLNAASAATPKVLLAAITPIILYLGGGLVGAVTWGLIVSTATVVLVFFLSARLLSRLRLPTFNRALLSPLFKFGGGWFMAMCATILLSNTEKILLSSFVSVKALAYYSVAFTVANMAVVFSWAMVQSLIPAFSQLLASEKRDAFNYLFSKSLRLSFIWLLPSLTILFVIAKPFFSIWAGEEFGRESTLPFYILLAGLFFNILAYVPYSAIVAAGHSGFLAKVYWLELVPYLVSGFLLINYFGIVGASIAWSVRVILDAVLLTWLARKYFGVSPADNTHFGGLAAAAVFLVPPLIVSVLFPNFLVLNGLFIVFAVFFYSVAIWKKYILDEEKIWLSSTVRSWLSI